MTVLNTGVRFEISVAGTPLPDEVAGALEAIEVSTSLVRPGSAVITFADPARVIMEAIRVSLGDEVEIATVVDTEISSLPLLDGDVVGLESIIGGGGSQTVVIVHDPLHRLQRSVESHTYRELPVADIVREVAERHSLQTGEVDDRGFPTLAVTNQLYETDFDFLSHLAAKVGVSLYWRQGQLHFAPSSPASDGPGIDVGGAEPLLVVREADLLRGRVSVSSVGASGASAAVGWDMAAKEPLTTSVPVGSEMVEPGEAPDSIAAVTGETPVAGATFASSQTMLDHAAQVHAERTGNRTAELELLVEGRPQLQAGKAITVAGLDEPFDGSYSITEVTHRYGPQLGYTTQLHVSGLEDLSVGGMTLRPQRPNPLMSGLVPALVSANRDEDTGAGRVRVQFPWLGEDVETDWLQVVTPGAGPQRGISFLPEVGDEVLVGFQAGDHRQPVVVGAAYNGQDQPPVELDQQVAGSGEVIRRAIVSRAGHRIVFVDAQGEESIEVTTADGGCHVILDQASRKVQIVSAGDLAIEASGNITIEAGANLTMSAQANAELSASANTKIEGLRIDLN